MPDIETKSAPDLVAQVDPDPERTAKMREGVIKFWSSSDVLLRQLGQERASSIKDYLVDKGQLADDRVYFIDANLGEAESDGRVVTPLHLDAE